MEIEQRLAQVEAQLAIQQLASRYARAVDSRNLDDLGALFAPQTPFGEYGTGAEGAKGFYRGALSGFYRSFHQVVGHVITDIEADSARGTVYCRAEHEDGDHWVVNLMVYFDRYVRVDGNWHFLGRRPRFLFVGDMKDGPRRLASTSGRGARTASAPSCRKVMPAGRNTGPSSPRTWRG